MGQYDQTFDLKINVCYCDLYFMVQTCISWPNDFALCLKDYLMDKCHIFQIMRQADPNFDLKINMV